MIRVYFDNVLIDDDSYTYLENDYKLFSDSFILGSTASNTFKLIVDKSVIASQPSEVKINDDDGNSYFLLPDSIVEDDNFYTYTLVDKLVLLNYNYDASPLINAGNTYLSDILKDMCDAVDIAVDSSLVLINDIQITWYDNTIQAREYLSYIAELQGGFVRFNNSGELTIIKNNSSSIATINIDECSAFRLGEKKVISRVIFDNGINSWSFGDETGVTVYLNPDNVFIVNETIVENIYDEIVGFEFYLLETDNCPIGSTVRAGDVLTFTDGVNSYNTIANYIVYYNGGWNGSYSLNINTAQQDTTPLADLSQKVKSLKVNLDRTENELSIVASEVDGNSQNIATLTESVNGVVIKVEEIDGIKDDVSEISAKVDGLEVNIISSGGTNLVQNSVGYFTGDWDVEHESYTDTDIKNNTISKNAWLLQNITSEQVIQVQNGTYTISGKYKKLITLADCKIIVNGYEINLTEEDWDTFTYTFEVLSNTITIDLISDTDNGCYVTDLMLSFGSLAQVWTPANGESVKGGVKIGNIIEVVSSVSNTKTVIDTDGNRIINTSTNEVVAEYTDKGMSAKEVEAEGGTIANLLIIDVGDQTWLSRL